MKSSPGIPSFQWPLSGTARWALLWDHMVLKREVSAPLELGGVTHMEWGARIEHPNGAVTHLPLGVELDEEYLQELHETAEFDAQLYPAGYDIDKGR